MIFSEGTEILRMAYSQVCTDFQFLLFDFGISELIVFFHLAKKILIYFKLSIEDTVLTRVLRKNLSFQAPSFFHLVKFHWLFRIEDTL